MNAMILQADKDAIIAAPLVRNEIETGLEKTNNLLFYRFFTFVKRKYLHVSY